MILRNIRSLCKSGAGGVDHVGVIGRRLAEGLRPVADDLVQSIAPGMQVHTQRATTLMGW